MDTKLKNFSRQWYLKILAYLIMVGCMIGMMQVIWAGWQNFEWNTVMDPVYKESEHFGLEVWGIIRDIMETEGSYESREAIERGEYVREEDVNRQMQDYYNQWVSKNRNIQFVPYDYNIEIEYGVFNGEWEELSWEELTYERFLNENPDLETAVKQIRIQNTLRNYDINKEHLEQEYPYFVYEIVKKDEDVPIIQGKINAYKTLPIYGFIGEDDIQSNNLQILQTLKKYKYNSNDSQYLFVGMEEDIFKEKSRQWNHQYHITRDVIKKVAGFLAGIIILLIYQLVVTGRRPKEENISFHFADHVWSEIQWGMAFILFCIEIFLLEEMYYGYKSSNALKLQQNFITLISIIIGTIFIGILLSQVKKIKAKKFLEGFIILRLIRRIFQKGKAILWSIWTRGKMFHRLLFLAIILPLLCGTWIGIPFVIVFVILMLQKYMGDFDQICKGAKIIRGGNLNYEITVKSGEALLSELAENINLMSQGLEQAVSSELRSERLKAELISNVSHDLKTPLTSIVTYVDLLKKEEISNHRAKDYIEVIDRKTKQLSILTNDLFEAAKASSGDLPVNLEKVDLKAILRQALGEFHEKLQAAALEVRIKLPEEPVYIKADGRLTWRILDNLLSNVVKYALSGSRVYMDVEVEKDRVLLIIKNISAFELNISADELMERFKRGDESRKSEGSGLGLNIANSLTDLQHGSFRIDVDGDLFKVTVAMRLFFD